MFSMAYTFKGQVHVFAGRVKIVSHSSCRTSAMFKYFCPLTLYSKTCVERPLSKRPKMVFKTNYHSKGSIVQYFRPSLSYHLSLWSLVCLFLSGCFTQVLLYNYWCFELWFSWKIFENVDSENKKNQQTTKKHEKLPSMHKLINMAADHTCETP